MSDYLLIDLENVPKPDLSAVPETTHVWIFVGAGQKVSSTLTEALVNRRGDFRKLTAAGQGRNALDLHIAYYLSQILAADPAARCRILSGDGDYDVLLAHLRQLGHQVSRSAALASARSALSEPEPARPVKAAPVVRSISVDALGEEICKLLRPLAAKNRPRTQNTLTNKLLSDLKVKLAGSGDPRQKIATAIDKLTGKGILQVANGRLSYHLA